MLDNTEGNTGRCDSASTHRSGVVKDPGMYGRCFAREPGDLGFGRRMDAAGPHREGEEP